MEEPRGRPAGSEAARPPEGCLRQADRRLLRRKSDEAQQEDGDERIPGLAQGVGQGAAGFHAAILMARRSGRRSWSHIPIEASSTSEAASRFTFSAIFQPSYVRSRTCKLVPDLPAPSAGRDAEHPLERAAECCLGLVTHGAADLPYAHTLLLKKA